MSSQSTHLNVQDSGKITLKDFLSGLGGVVALGTLMFGVYQYRANQQWKKAELIAKQVKEFEDDPDVKNVMIMLDWNEPEIILSEEYIIKRVTENTLKICLISGDLDSQRKQLEALNGQQEFTTEQAMIRNAFSKFLDYLERFDNFIEAKLIGKKN